MAGWKYEIDLSDVFHDSTRTFKERRDAIVARIKHVKMKNSPVMEESFMVLINELAKSSDAEDFNFWWDYIYDWADDNRVWIVTR